MSHELVPPRLVFGVYPLQYTHPKRHCFEDRYELLHARYRRFNSVMLTPLFSEELFHGKQSST